MGYVHGFSTAKHILKDLALQITTGDLINTENNWDLAYPVPVSQTVSDKQTILGANDDGQVINKVVLKCKTKLGKIWEKKKELVVEAGTGAMLNFGVITLPTSIYTTTVQGNTTLGGARVYVKDKKYSLYRISDVSGEGAELDALEFHAHPASPTKIYVNKVLVGKTVLVDYEKADTTVRIYYVELKKDSPDDYNSFTWRIGTDFNDVDCSFPTDHYSMEGKVNWFREGVTPKTWLPIEYWITFDYNSVVGVIMGDPGYSVADWMSSPFYFGMLEQIDGALESDIQGNMAAFGGSDTEPEVFTTYGDYTANGKTDVIMAKTKTGRPYNAHKLQVFGGYEFREKTFNGQSAHTGKHAVSDIVVADVHENDRGILRYCLAVPKIGKEHGTELVYKRYIAGEERTYIFLNINAPYTPFNTSPDDLLGIAIQMDI